VHARFPGQSVGAPVQAVQGGAQGNVVNYSDARYVAGEVTWFGLGLNVVPAGGAGGTTTDFNIKPLRPTTPQKIFCPSTIQGIFIAQAAIGGTNIFASSLGVPIELFSEVSTAPQIDWPTIDTSVGIDFFIFNPIGAPATAFEGALYGTAIRR
jgi:hypothetical protein